MDRSLPIDECHRFDMVMETMQMNHGWKTRIEERRYFEEKKKAQQEHAYAKARLERQWETEVAMMELNKKNKYWSAFA